MDRNQFLKSVLLTPALVAGYTPGRTKTLQTIGLRRLSADNFFTEWKPKMDPAYYVGINEVVLIEMSHGMPGLVFQLPVRHLLR